MIYIMIKMLKNFDINNFDFFIILSQNINDLIVISSYFLQSDLFLADD